MTTHVLMKYLRGSSWEYIPDDMWRNTLNRFATKFCDSVSFDCFTTPDDIGNLTVFADHCLAYIGQSFYKPTSIPISVADPDTYLHDVALFHFDEWIASLILQQPLNNWHTENEGTHADEMVLWAGDRMKLHAIPYEGKAYFDDWTANELQCLMDADGRIERNLYAV